MKLGVFSNRPIGHLRPSPLCASKRFILPRRLHRNITIRANSSAPTTGSVPASAADCVNQGLELFQKGDVQGSVTLFQAAMTKRPNSDEARAATYNLACAYTKLKRWQEAADMVRSAVNDHDLKLIVAMKDDDLAPLRERREFQDALFQLRGYVSKDQMVNMRSESKAPFRFARLAIFGSLLAGAGLGLIVITGRLLAAFKGGEGAPELNETLKNFGINAAAVTGFSALLYFDLKKDKEQKLVIEREEEMAKLQLFIGPERQITLLQLRQQYRPVILAGPKSQVVKAMKAAETYRKELQDRAVLLVPLMSEDADYDERINALKVEMARGAAQAERDAKGFAAPAAAPEAPKPRKNIDRWRAEVAEVGEWRAWFDKQKAAARLDGNNLVYIQVQLDGTVRASGKGSPPWGAFVDDIPEKGSARSKMTDEGAA